MNTSFKNTFSTHSIKSISQNAFKRTEMTSCKITTVAELTQCVCVCTYSVLSVVHLPAVFQVKDYLVDDVTGIQETPDIFKHFLPDEGKHM